MKKLLFGLIILNVIFLGCSSDSDNDLNETPDVILPQLDFSLAGITENQTSEPVVVSNQIEINIDAKDEGGIAKIEAFLNNEKVGEDTSAPYKIIIDVSSFTSKAASTNKYKNYTLKITATDKSGNQTSKEQIINIDNEKPTISSVSLEDGSIINGSENLITFDAIDNESLNSVKVYINDEQLPEVVLTDMEININTTVLEDGVNTLKIEAIDNAENVTVHSVDFITDNTGPEIKVENLLEGMIIDEEVLVNIRLTDTHSEIDSVKITINDSIVSNHSYIDPITYTLNPDEFSTGENSIQIETSDTLGNTALFSSSHIIHRRLLKVTLENETINPSYAKFYVFASSSNGELLDIEEATISTKELILNTPIDLGPNEEFMVTFAGYISGYGDYSGLSTFQNVTRNNLKIINLKKPPKVRVISNKEYTVINNPSDTGIDGYGSSYNSSYFSDEDRLHMGIRDVINSNNEHSDKIYLKSYNYNNNVYSYMLLDAPIQDNFIIDYSNFSSIGVENRFYNAPFELVNNGKSASLMLYGFLNETDRINESSHLLWNQGRGIETNFDFSNGILYRLDTQFDSYRYELQLEDYYTERTGIPLTYYSYPDWSVDFVQNDYNVQVNSSGIEHTTGSLFLEGSETVDNLCRWNILFDSQTTTNVTLPQLPEELSSWNVSDLYNSASIEAKQVELKRYEGVNSYEDYLIKAVQPNISNRKVSDFMESTFYNPDYNIRIAVEDMSVIY